MSRRTQIIDFLVTELKRINKQQDARTVPVRNGYTYKTNVFNNVFRRQKYLNEINDFPTICVRATGEDRLELGAGVRFGTFGFEIRAYVKNEAIIETEEDLADDIEFVLENLKPFLIKGAIILFDELYNFEGWDVGEYKALTEVFDEKDYSFVSFSTDTAQAAIKILN